MKAGELTLLIIIIKQQMDPINTVMALTGAKYTRE